MIDESMDTEQLKQEPQPWEFRSKPAWQRLIIMLGGITVNILLAWFLYTVVYSTYGQKYIATEKFQEHGLSFGDVGKSAGFQNGDKIVSVDGQFQEKYNRMIIDILLGTEVVVNRNGENKTIILTDENKRDILKKEGRNFIGPRLQKIVVDSINPKGGAPAMGLKIGDRIVGVNGKPTPYFDVLTDELKKHKNDSISLTVERNNANIVLKGKVDKEGVIGFGYSKEAKKEYEKFEVVNHMNFIQAFPKAVEESYTQFVYNIKQFKLLLKPKTEAYKQVKSPIGITRQLPTEWDWEFIWKFTAMFSIGLAFMNLLPIPGLDGGHALFTIAEMITGRTLSEKAMGYVQTGGMIFLLSLMALTFGKDIYEIIIDNFFKKV